MKLQTPLVALALLALSCSGDTGSDASSVDGDSPLDVGTDAPQDTGDLPGADAPDTPGDATADAPDTTLPETCQADRDCDDGIFCNGAERCFNGECFASRRPQCEDHLPCTVDGCDEEARLCQFTPDEAECEDGEVCDPKAGCFRPAECLRNEDCDDGLVCNGQEVCGRDGMCAPGLPVVCDDGVLCTRDECVEELGACQNVPDHTQCLPTELCNVQEGCDEPPPCSNDDDCNDASFCNGEETCDEATGACLPGPTPAVDDRIHCTIDSCSDQLGQVVHTPHAARCSDGMFCNGAEICHPVDGCQGGEPPVFSDGVGCTTDRCDEVTDFIEHIADDAPCDDGLFCNGDEVCHPVDGCQPGEPPAVNDGVGCTVDTCSEVQHAVLNVPSDEACDDGLFCNGAETCDVQMGCQPGDAPLVDDRIDCTQDRCDEDADRVVHSPQNSQCDDDLFCNGAETCSPDTGCVDGPVPGLDDGVGCTDDRCDEERDLVEHAPNHARCDDGAFCNGTEMCDVLRDCISTGAPALDDNVGCTDDRCDEINDRVIHIPQNAQCDDGRFCNGTESCHVINDCQNGPAPALNDGVGCTDDRCDEANDRVIHVANDGLCNDNLYCNGQETCHPQNDCQTGTAPTLTDGVDCTVDRCDEQGDTVTHTPNHQSCQDGLWCNGAEVCDPRDDCLPGTPQPVSDNVDCTDDRCDEANGRVVHTVNDDNCDDDLWCNGQETCHAQLDCRDGIPPIEEDEVPCTEAVCDEANDQIVQTPRNARCDDGEVCNGQETCRREFGCLPGIDADNGTVCQEAPPLECMDGECVDPDPPFPWSGRYDVVPDVSYRCAQSILFPDTYGVEYGFTHLQFFDDNGVVLQVTPSPNGPATFFTMEQRPTPQPNTFSVSVMIPGLSCNETYSLTGLFITDDAWMGTFTRTYVNPGGFFGDCRDCQDGSVQLTGTRQ